MKKKPAILVFILSLAISKAQTKTGYADSLFHPHSQELFLDFNSQPLSFPQYTLSILNHYQTPKMPFFCSMEDKFRNRFHIFLKLRAGTDDQYEKMIKPTEK